MTVERFAQVHVFKKRLTNFSTTPEYEECSS